MLRSLLWPFPAEFLTRCEARLRRVPIGQVPKQHWHLMHIEISRAAALGQIPFPRFLGRISDIQVGYPNWCRIRRLDIGRCRSCSDPVFRVNCDSLSACCISCCAHSRSSARELWVRFIGVQVVRGGDLATQRCVNSVDDLERFATERLAVTIACAARSKTEPCRITLIGFWRWEGISELPRSHLRAFVRTRPPTGRGLGVSKHALPRPFPRSCLTW